MNNCCIRNNKGKNFYSKAFRKRAFFELSKGKPLFEIFKDINFKIDERLKKDKKYLSKLTFKWKKEFFENPRELMPNYCPLSEDNLYEYISLLGDENEDDFLEDIEKENGLKPCSNLF